MIKINLLTEKRQQPIGASKDLTYLLFGFAVVLALEVLTLGGWYWSISSGLEAKRLQAAELQAEANRLRALEVEVQRYQEQKAQLDARLAVVQSLRENRWGPVKMMNSVVSSVPDPPQLWLTNLTQSGSVLSMEGNAVDVPSLAAFITKLENKPPFRAVDLDFWQDDGNNLRFKLTCQLGEDGTAAGAAQAVMAAEAGGGR